MNKRYRAFQLLTVLLLALPMFAPAAVASPRAATQDAASVQTAKDALTAAYSDAQAKREALSSNADADTQAAADAAETALESAVDGVQTQIDALDAAGDSTGSSELAAFLADTTNIIDPSNLDVGMLANLAETWTIKGKDWVVDELPGYVANLAILLVIYLIFKVLGGVLARLTNKALSSSKMNISTLLRDFSVTIVRKGTIVIGLVIGLSTIGINMGPVLAGLGVFGFVIGFALQDTMGNFAAGVMLLLYRPFDVGDFINAAGVAGSVRSLSLVSTTLTTPDNQTVIIPNGSIWGGVITNVTAQDTRRIDLVAGIGYTDDIEKAEKVLAEIVAAHPLVLKDPAPSIRLSELADSSVNFVVRPWCKTSNYWGVKCDLTKSIKQRFDAEGISIPYPQQDIHLFTDKPLETK
ncbi:MAG: small conductance mechanosensitive channel [Planctomycetota bacterium]|jgi:small conductance mechanosensitive channel